jgi:hypothetical protein
MASPEAFDFSGLLLKAPHTTLFTSPVSSHPVNAADKGIFASAYHAILIFLFIF